MDLRPPPTLCDALWPAPCRADTGPEAPTRPAAQQALAEWPLDAPEAPGPADPRAWLTLFRNPAQEAPAAGSPAPPMAAAEAPTSDPAAHGWLDTVPDGMQSAPAVHTVGADSGSGSAPAFASAPAPAPVPTSASTAPAGHQRAAFRRHRRSLGPAAADAHGQRLVEVVGEVFEQMLADEALPPGIARQMARLQFPVLKLALVDPGVFSLAQHPVRRFLNRVAALASACGDEHTEAGAALLACVARLVQALIASRFDQSEPYAQALQALEAWAAQRARRALQPLGDPSALLARKEAQLRREQAHGQRLWEALQPAALPDFMRDFLARRWGRLIACGEAWAGPASAPAQQARTVARALALSVQPMGSPALRQRFLRELAPLMRALQQGMDTLGLPEGERERFFAQWLPAQAEAMKAAPLALLEHNLRLKALDAALSLPLPAPPLAEAGPQAEPAGDAPMADARRLQALAATVVFSPREAQALGVVPEAAMEAQPAPEMDRPAAQPELTSVDIQIDGLPAADAPEPSRGQRLADHLQLGLAYELHIDGRWTLVHLQYVSPNRSFFVFTHGGDPDAADTGLDAAAPGCARMVTMTYRTVVRLCQTGRLRALERAQWLERATARARAQLAALLPAARGR